jgi:hypothetical protein
MNAVALATRPPQRPARAAVKRDGPMDGKSGGGEAPVETPEPESVLAKLLARFSRK